MGDASDASASAEWYAQGLRFECTQCGNCCTGPPGYVWFTEDEGRAMATFLGMDEQAFLERYARRDRNRHSLRERQTKHGYDCIFLDRDTEPGKALCRVYGERPAQCRTWPFWPENIKSQEDWDLVREVTPCPGIGRGPLVRIEQIRIQRDATP